MWQTADSYSMVSPHNFPLESIRTDGWFERIGEGIGSFQTLCEVVGARFFAFAMIAGARIVALTIDRRAPENTLVDFVVAGDEAELRESTPQRLPLGEFRRRLVSALLTEEPTGPVPTRLMDVEAIQRHIGVRYLLLAPIFGYGLLALNCDAYGSMIRAMRDGTEEIYELEEFRTRIRLHIREELQRSLRGTNRGAIDLAKVVEAEAAAEAGDNLRVVELIGTWPAPLAIFLRTSEGQSLPPEIRARISKALGLLGQACIQLGELDKGHEVLRLAIQYAAETDAAAGIFLLLGRSMYDGGRFGEALGVLKRADSLGADARIVWPLLARAYAERGLWAPALAAELRARRVGGELVTPEALLERAKRAVGPAFEIWQQRVQGSSGSL
jgi:tetratricopeptide (TPR) repeat protein